MKPAFKAGPAAFFFLFFSFLLPSAGSPSADRHPIDEALLWKQPKATPR
jgi:hypothetical protein